MVISLQHSVEDIIAEYVARYFVLNVATKKSLEKHWDIQEISECVPTAASKS